MVAFIHKNHLTLFFQALDRFKHLNILLMDYVGFVCLFLLRSPLVFFLNRSVSL